MHRSVGVTGHEDVRLETRGIVLLGLEAGVERDDVGGRLLGGRDLALLGIAAFAALEEQPLDRLAPREGRRIDLPPAGLRDVPEDDLAAVVFVVAVAVLVDTVTLGRRQDLAIRSELDVEHVANGVEALLP